MYWYICFLPGWSWAEIKCTVHIALPQTAHKLVLTGSAKALRTNCANKFTVPILSIASQEQAYKVMIVYARCIIQYVSVALLHNEAKIIDINY